jgi:hypothetical protein
MTSPTSNSSMHFSMAIAPPAFWLVVEAMLVGKSAGANDASRSFVLPQGGIAKPKAAVRGETRPDDFLKFR